MLRVMIVTTAAAAALFALPAPAQTPAKPAKPAAAAPTPDERILTSEADVARLIAEAAAGLKPGEPVATRPILTFGGYTALLEYRVAATIAAIHRDEEELFYVLKGAGTLTLGGTLVNPKPIDAHNEGGSASTGGTPRRVAAGDVLVVRAGTPHWFNAVEAGGPLVMISIKTPRKAS